MSKLQRRSDGAAETQDGMFAVKIRVASGSDGVENWFEFKATMMGPVVRISWPKGSIFALLPQAEARTLVQLGYAIGITQEEMDAYNATVDADGGKGSAPIVTPTIEPAKPTPLQEATAVPSWVNPQAAPVAEPVKTLQPISPATPTAPPVASAPLQPISPLAPAPVQAKPTPPPPVVPLATAAIPPAPTAPKPPQQ